MSTWTLRPAATTAAVGRSKTTSGGMDTWGRTRWYLKFDLTGYSGGNATIYPSTASGTITKADSYFSGTPPDPVSP